MAKKLITDYEIVPASDIVKIKGKWKAEQVLLITDVDSNAILYNFASSGSGTTAVSYDSDTEFTSLTLEQDLSGLTTSSNLQIFVDDAYTIIDFPESFYDPVNKLRVSNPENLIDTDFEYGLQSSKWETLELVNNIPSYHSTTGDSSIADIVSVTVTSGSDLVTVRTQEEHKLTIGTPVDVRGLASVTAEGNFLISAVPDSKSFIYKAVTQSQSNNISGVYTSIIAGRFFSGSALDYDQDQGITSDGAALSKLTINTPYAHGFKAGTEIYLINTLGTKKLVLDAVSTNAPDGRPYVDPDETISQNILPSLDLTKTETKGVKGAHSVKFNESAVNYANNTITWTDHKLQSNDCVVYMAPMGADEISGLNRFDVYYVIRVDDNTIRLTNTASGSAISLSSGGSWALGLHQLMFCWEVRSYNKFANQGETTWNTPFYLTGSGSGRDLVQATSSKSNLYGTVLGNTQPQHYLLVQRDTDTVTWSTTVVYDLYSSKRSTSHKFPMLSTDSNVDSRYQYNPIENPESVYGSYYGGFASESGYWYGASRYLNSDNGRLLLRNYGFPRYNTAYSQTGTNENNYIIPLIKDPESNTLHIDNHGLNSGSTVTLTTSGQLATTSGSHPYIWNTGTNKTINLSQSGNALTVNKISDDKISFQSAQLHYVTPTISAFVADASNLTANTFYFAGHGLTTGDEVLINVQNSGAVPTVDSGDLIYTGDDAPLLAVHGQVKNIIEAWQAANSAKTQSYAVNDPFYIQTLPNSNLSGNTLNQINIGYNHYGTASVTLNNQGLSFDDFTDGQITVVSPIVGAKMVVENLDTNGASVPYALQVIGVDPEQSNRSYGKEFQLYHFTSSSAATFYGLASNTVSSGVRYNCNVHISPSTNQIAGWMTFVVSIQKDVWDTDLTYASQLYNFVRDYGSYTRSINGGNRGYDSSIFIRFDMAIAPNQTISSSDANGILTSIVSAFQNNLTKPTLTAGDTVVANVVNNDRFRTSASVGGIPHDLTNHGTADITFETSTAGAIDGTYKIGDVTSTSYELDIPFEVSARSISFADTDVNTTEDLITLADHGLQDGAKLTYSEGTGTVTGLTDATEYFAIVQNNNQIAVAATLEDARLGSPIDLTATTAGTLIFAVDSIAALTEQSGVVSTTSGSKIITGDEDSLFKRYWKRGDELILLNNSVTPATYETGIIDVIPTDGEIHLEQEVNFTSASTSIFRNTEVYVRPNGSFQHRPFDGGVEIQTGTSPNSSISRQTRKYFRYQSGKGIQTSYAINFNPPTQAETVTGSGTTATITTKYPHRLLSGFNIEVVGSENADYNGTFVVGTVLDDFTFTYEVAGASLLPTPSGFIQVYVGSYSDSYVRAGMFDYQNGFFYEFDGQHLYCVRRSSTQQLSGTATVTNRSHRVNGLNTTFLGQVAVGDMIVIRGQSYKIVDIPTQTTMDIQPAYRGVNASGAIITKTVDTKIVQSEWNIDTCDGNGKSGFDLDLKKIQMCYMDYSWYGAGKIRFGFKDTYGHVIYTHEFIHNNRLIESYFRSGNLPARYEVGTLDQPNYTPNLFHWGTSVMMDGTFDDDKAYLFTANSNNLNFSNGQSVTANTTNNSYLSFVYNWQTRRYDWYVSVPFATSDASKLTSGTQLYTVGGELTGEKIDYVAYESVSGVTRVVAKIYITSSRNTPQNGTYPSVPASTTVSIGAEASGESIVDLGNELIPIISIRLAPSVDGSLVGALGQRDIINRMQLKLNTIGVVLTHDCEVSLILNSDLSTSNFEGVGSPSLCQLIRHEVGDAVIGGTNLYQFRASGGAADSAGQNASVTSNFELGEIIDLGNSILGGDGVYPNGPDLLTVAVKLLDTSGVDGVNKFVASSRISWAESQA